MSKTKPRQYGSGSLYQRKSDGLWIGAIQVGWTSRGTRRTITVSGKTEAAVKARLEKRKRDLARDGVPAEGMSTSVTVKGWSEQWLKIVVTQQRPKAYAATLGAVKNWIVPSIGHKRLDALTPGDVRAFHARMRKGDEADGLKPLAQSSMVRHHSTLMTMLQAAMTEGAGYRVPPNVLVVKPPKLGESDRTNMQLDQALKVLGLAADLPDGSRWAAALLQGIRKGEALGLTWDLIDFEQDLIDISWQLQPLPYIVKRDPSSGFRVPDGFIARQLIGQMHLTRPKTAAGRRIIPMVPWMRSALLAWREVAPASPYGLVWPRLEAGPRGAAVGSPRSERDDQAQWHALQAQVGVLHPSGRPYTGHETRHTTISLLLELGVDRSVIAAIVGQAKLVESYAHVHHAQARKALEQVAERLQLIPAA